eukprot:gene9443-19616_t
MPFKNQEGQEKDLLLCYEKISTKRYQKCVGFASTEALKATEMESKKSDSSVKSFSEKGFILSKYNELRTKCEEVESLRVSLVELVSIENDLKAKLENEFNLLSVLKNEHFKKSRSEPETVRAESEMEGKYKEVDDLRSSIDEIRKLQVEIKRELEQRLLGLSKLQDELVSNEKMENETDLSHAANVTKQVIEDNLNSVLQELKVTKLDLDATKSELEQLKIVSRAERAALLSSYHGDGSHTKSFDAIIQTVNSQEITIKAQEITIKSLDQALAELERQRRTLKDQNQLLHIQLDEMINTNTNTLQMEEKNDFQIEGMKLELKLQQEQFDLQEKQMLLSHEAEIETCKSSYILKLEEIEIVLKCKDEEINRLHTELESSNVEIITWEEKYHSLEKESKQDIHRASDMLNNSVDTLVTKLRDSQNQIHILSEQVACERANEGEAIAACEQIKEEKRILREELTHTKLVVAELESTLHDQMTEVQRNIALHDEIVQQMSQNLLEIESQRQEENVELLGRILTLERELEVKEKLFSAHENAQVQATLTDKQQLVAMTDRLREMETKLLTQKQLMEEGRDERTRLMTSNEELSTALQQAQEEARTQAQTVQEQMTALSSTTTPNEVMTSVKDRYLPAVQRQKLLWKQKRLQQQEQQCSKLNMNVNANALDPVTNESEQTAELLAAYLGSEEEVKRLKQEIVQHVKKQNELQDSLKTCYELISELQN